MFNIVTLWIINVALWWNGIVFKEAKSIEDLDLVYRLRYDVYLSEGYITSNDKRRFQDSYDDSSVNFLVYKEGNPIGTFRLILNSERGFWTEAIFNFVRPDFPRESMAEISRLGVLKEYRGTKLIMAGLMKTVYQYAKRNGIAGIYFNVPAKLAGYIKSFGVPVIKLQEEEPTQEILKNRELIAGYFKKSKLEPYFITLS